MQYNNEEEQLKQNNELKFEIIVTSHKYNQLLMTIIMSKNISEKEFISNILESLDKKYFDTLVKLSCCQCYCNSNEKLMPFLLKSFGKYYFDNNGNSPEFEFE